MTGWGCACEWCGSTYEAQLWREPFWCPVCTETLLRLKYKDYRPRHILGAA